MERPSEDGLVEKTKEMKMNKLIATLIATACAGAMAQYVVYDYSSSIKRLNPEIKKFSSKGKKASACEPCTPATKGWISRFAVKSDKVTGFVQLPICNSCVEGGVAGTFYEGIPDNDDYYYNTLLRNPKYGLEFSSNCEGNGFYGVAWLTRKNDKFAKSTAYPVYKVVVRAEAGMFGSYVDVNPSSDQTPWNDKDNKKAWMSLSYAMPNVAEKMHLDMAKFAKGAGTGIDFYPYGFLGWGNNRGTTVYETGFGTANSTTLVFGGEGVCGGTTSTATCHMIKQISGTLVGWPTIIAPCDKRAIWDLCDVAFFTEQSVISGTWSIKYNKTVTADGKLSTQEKNVLKKLGVTSKQVYDTTDADLNEDKRYWQPAQVPGSINHIPFHTALDNYEVIDTWKVIDCNP